MTISCDPIYGNDFEAEVQVTASVEEVSANFTFAVTIQPGNKNKKPKAPPPKMTLEKVNEMGVATLRFDSPVIVFDKPFDAFMIEPSHFLEFEIIHNPLSNYADDPKYIDSGKVISVAVTSFKPWQIEVQLEFSNPLYISLDQFNRDDLRVTIVNENAFISAVDFVTTSLRGSSSQIEVFRQMGKQQSSSTDRVSKS